MDNLPEQSPSYISLHLSTKGKYSWDIKVNFREKFVEHDQALTRISEIDQELRQKFPNNTAEMKNTGKFGAFGTDEE